MFKHPWKKWFSKKKVILTRGEDYSCQPHSMGVQIRNAATRLGVSVRVLIKDDKITILRRV